MMCVGIYMQLRLFVFNYTATTEIYTLSLHDALPICGVQPDAPHATPNFHCWDERDEMCYDDDGSGPVVMQTVCSTRDSRRSEEHTSELQSRQYLVCRLLLEKKKIITLTDHYPEQSYH